MPAESSIPNALDKIRKLKRSVNPATGKPYSNQAIATLYDMSPEWVRYMTRGLRGCCTKCLRPLEQSKK